MVDGFTLTSISMLVLGHIQITKVSHVILAQINLHTTIFSIMLLSQVSSRIVLFIFTKTFISFCTSLYLCLIQCNWRIYEHWIITHNITCTIRPQRSICTVLVLWEEPGRLQFSHFLHRHLAATIPRTFRAKVQYQMHL